MGPAAYLPPESTTLIGKFATGINNTNGKMPQVLMVLLIPVASCTTGINDTAGGKFAAGVHESGGKFHWYQ